MKSLSHYAENCNFTYGYKLILSAFFSAVMFVFILFTGENIGLDGNNIPICAGYFSLLYFSGMAVFFYSKRVCKIETVLFFGAALAAAMYIRCALMYYASGDYNTFLFPWIQDLSQYQGISGLAADIGDYTTPYRVFLMVLSKIGGSKLHQIKMFSLVFDIVGAYFVMKIVELRSKSITMRTMSFILTLLAPTVFYNSAMWGQCDMMFTAFCLGGLYFALTNRGNLAVIMTSIAFCFKIQTIFFFPVIIILLLVKKIRWRDLLWFPLVLLVANLPSIFAGKGLSSIFSAYFIQVNEYPKLYLNIPSVWMLVGSDSVRFESFNMIGIMLAGVAACSLIYLGYKYRYMLDERRLISLAFISVLLIPFLLPRMHERYFFAADILSILYFFYNKKRWFVPVVVIFTSYNSYAKVLYGILNINGNHMALVLVALLSFTLYELVRELRSGELPENPLLVKVPVVATANDAIDEELMERAFNVKNGDTTEDTADIADANADDNK